MSRRGMNIYKRKDGRWEGRISRVENNKRKYISIYGKTYQEVKNKMAIKMTYISAERTGTSVQVEIAVSLWLRDKKAYWKQTTYASYKNVVDKYVVPLLGSKQMTEINNIDMENFVSNVRRLTKKAVLSQNYLHNICSVVIMALSYAKRKYRSNFQLPDNPVPTNKSNQILLPAKTDMIVLEKYLLENIQDDTCLGILLAFYTGIRIGELCALTWEDIDLQEEVVYIRKNLQRVKTEDSDSSCTKLLLQDPKTPSSCRAIPLAPILVPVLKKYRKENTQHIIQGKKYPWAEPRTLQYRFSQILRKCGIKKFHFHMLRHAFATRCIAGGFDIKSLSEILGHSSVQITMNLYVHSDMRRKKQLMDMFSLHLWEND